MHEGWNPSPRRRELFWRFVNKGDPDECWPWMLVLSEAGYGHSRVDGWSTTAHRIAYALTFGIFDNSLVVRHRCDSPSCCNPDHLVLGTQAQNMADKHARGRHGDSRNYGEKSGRALLTDAQVEEIRRRYAAEGISQRDLGRQFGVGQSQIGRIVNGESRLIGQDRNSPPLAKLIKDLPAVKRGAVGKKGRRPRPPRKELRKITFAEAEQLRAKKKAGATYLALAAEYGLGLRTVFSIVKRHTYQRP